MSRPTEWLQRLSGIVSLLESSPEESILDRRDIELLFSVGQRQAVALLHRFGAQRTGGALVVTRQALLDYLGKLQKEPDFQQAEGRRERVELKLRESWLQARARAVPIRTEVAWGELLPQGVSLEPGCLKVEFEEGMELLERLYALARSIAGNFEEFEGKLNLTRSVLFPEQAARK